MEGQDFIASELLSELKESSARKDNQIAQLHKNFVKLVFAFVAALLLTVGGFLLYLNQYDFSSTSTVENSAEGVYALIDSSGNTIAWDITPEQLNEIFKVIDDGSD